MSINVQKSLHELDDDRFVRIGTSVKNPDQTGYTGYMVVRRGQEDCFWQGVDAAQALADANFDNIREVDCRVLYQDRDIDIEDRTIFSLGVRAVFMTWQPDIGLYDQEYIRHTHYYYSQNKEEFV